MLPGVWEVASKQMILLSFPDLMSQIPPLSSFSIWLQYRPVGIRSPRSQTATFECPVLEVAPRRD